MTKDEIQWLQDVVVQGRAPLKFDTGGGDFGGFGDGAGQGGGYGDSGGGGGGGYDSGPGGTDTRSEISVDYGGTGPSVGDTVGQGSVSGPTSGYGYNSELAAVLDAINAGLDIGGPAATQAALNAAMGNLSPSDIAALNAANLGYATGFNINNPTQSLEEMQAAQNFARYGAPAIIAAIPGASMMSSLARGIGSLISGQTTPGQFAGQLGLGLLASKTGIPSNVLSPAISGNFNTAAQNLGLGLAQRGLAQALDLPSGVVGVGMNAVMDAFGGRGTSSTGAGASTSFGGDFGGIDFSGVGGSGSGSESYDPTQQLAASTKSYAPAQYGYNPNDLADVRAGLQKTPFGVMPYGDYYG